MVAKVFVVYPEIPHFKVYNFAATRPRNLLLIYLRNTLLFNTFYCLLCLYTKFLPFDNLKTNQERKFVRVYYLC